MFYGNLAFWEISYRIAGVKMENDLRKCWRSIGVWMAMADLKSSNVPRPGNSRFLSLANSQAVSGRTAPSRWTWSSTWEVKMKSAISALSYSKQVANSKVISDINILSRSQRIIIVTLFGPFDFRLLSPMWHFMTLCRNLPPPPPTHTQDCQAIITWAAF